MSSGNKDPILGAYLINEPYLSKKEGIFFNQFHTGIGASTLIFQTAFLWSLGLNGITAINHFAKTYEERQGKFTWRRKASADQLQPIIPLNVYIINNDYHKRDISNMLNELAFDYTGERLRFKDDEESETCFSSKKNFLLEHFNGDGNELLEHIGNVSSQFRPDLVVIDKFGSYGYGLEGSTNKDKSTAEWFYRQLQGLMDKHNFACVAVDRCFSLDDCMFQAAFKWSKHIWQIEFKDNYKETHRSDYKENNAILFEQNLQRHEYYERQVKFHPCQFTDSQGYIVC
jgi:hypothetical protein